MALRFELNSYLDAPQAAATAPPLTLSAWCRTPSVVNIYALAVSSDSGNDLFGLSAFTDNRVIAVMRSGGAFFNSATTAAAYPINTWFHMAAVFESATLRTAYLNGGSPGSAFDGVPPTGLTRTRLRNRPGVLSPFDGVELAEVAIWNAALSPEEIALLAAGVSPVALAGRWGQLTLGCDLIGGAGLRKIGPTMTAVGTVAPAAHPRVFHTAPSDVTAPSDPRRWMLVAAEARCGGATAQSTFLPGASAGLAFSSIQRAA